MSFQVALTGLDAAQSNLDVISNNIANSNTSGFKRSRAEFADVYATSAMGTASNATGAGVRVTNIRQQHTQGDINYTDNNLDIAISGGGLFRMEDSDGSTVYSRAGAFGLDREGFISNATEQRLTGYQVDDQGTILPTLGTLEIDRADLQPQATGTLEVVANLDKTTVDPSISTFSNGDPKSYNFSTGATLYDSQGSTHVVNFYYKKTATPSEWEMYVEPADTGELVDSDVASATAASGFEPLKFTMTFGNDGKLSQLTDNRTTTTGPWLDTAAGTNNPFEFDLSASDLGGAVDPITLAVDMSRFTQFDATSGVNSVTADGFSSGRLSTLDIDKSGVVFGRYTNGQSQAMGQIALANFSNLEGLNPVGDSAWAETYASGAPAVGAPGSASLGFIQSSALEQSNVDITEELVDMIGAQRSFQANAQTISAADTLTQTIINIGR